VSRARCCVVPALLARTRRDIRISSSCSAHLRVVLLALEATGHYWRNLFVALLAKGYAVAVLNPLRTRRFAEEELQRTKTDAIDALGIARLAAQKRPPAAELPDSATEELRELARLRERLAEDFASRLRQLHRAVDLAFRNSRGMCAHSRASSRPPFCRATQLRRRFVMLR
jgi:transposase